MLNTQLYIHIPYCRSKCLYCDFLSGSPTTPDWDALTTALISELHQRHSELDAKPSFIYIGGGTPSLMHGRNLNLLTDAILQIWPDCKPVEFTIEVNPEDVSDENCRAWKAMGVNRVSMGVQSFNDSELAAVCRNHDARCAVNSFNILKKYFDNVSIDLIFGLPHQSLSSFENSLNRAIALNPQHISCYTLMLEPGTPLTVLASKGRVTLPEEDEVMKMWDILNNRLADEGYKRYEISNYAKPGYESRHNSGYWNGNPYLGIGPSASSFDGKRIRRANSNDINRYIKSFGNGNRNTEPFYEEELLSEDERREEVIMLSMRTMRGLDIDTFISDFGTEAGDWVMSNARRQLQLGTVEVVDGHLRLTDDGIMQADSVIVDLTM